MKNILIEVEEIKAFTEVKVKNYVPLFFNDLMTNPTLMRIIGSF